MKTFIEAIQCFFGFHQYRHFLFSKICLRCKKLVNKND